ncbi:peptidase domain-containing ABC transporter [Lysinibacillus xylanilyticus]|uniref:peptidase domain-containing ABC transporter n=1 Tax=Lysinibacillus xylanilyticus TaxID=582475 RepID=UPI003811C4F4
MRKISYIEQMHHSECGLASLAMLLNYYGHCISLSELREIYGVSKGGTSLYQITKIAESYNLNTEGYRVIAEDLKNIKLPAILHWENKHYVVLERINNRKAIIVDPAQGRKSITFKEFESKYSGIALTLSPNEDFQLRKGTSHVRYFLNYILKSKKLVAAIIFTSLIAQVVALGVPWLIQWMTDTLFVPKDQNLLSLVGYGVLLLFSGYFVFSGLRGILIAKLQTAVDKSLMTDFVSKLMKLTYSFFENRSTGELLFRANSNVYIRQILSTKVITVFIDVVLLISYLVMMASYSLKLMGVVLSLGIIIFVTLISSTKISRKLAEKEVSHQARVQGILSESLNGIGDVKVMGMEKSVYEQWHKVFKKQIKYAERRSIWTMFINTIATALQFILPVLLLWLSGKALINGSMSLGMVLAFNALSTAFIAPIISLGNSYGELIYLGTYIQKLYDVITGTEEKQGEVQENLSLKGEIELKNVSYKHNFFSEHSLKNISFKVNPGERLAIVGSSGSGKSTLVKILLGLYKPTEGDVYVDQKSINEYELGQLRQNMGVVFQEARLFNKTIYENIALAKEDMPLEEAVVAAYRANIHEEIMKLPLNYHTTVSEFGINFSGGQRQRMILARALAQDPSILILDEATSALDTVSEKKITDYLKTLDSTQILIAHRLSTIRDVDRIIVMDKGEVVEIGNHQELLNKKGFYYRLYTTQQLEEGKNEEMVV